jgi:hypothetical protein
MISFQFISFDLLIDFLTPLSIRINKILMDTSLNNNLLLDQFKQSLISADKKAKSSLEEKHKWANKDLKNSFKEFVNRIIE